MKNTEQLTIKDLTVSYGKRIILDKINVQLPQGVCGLLGRNGSGKTSLMRTLTGLQQAASGTVQFAGQEKQDQSTEILQQSIGYVPQFIDFIPYWTAPKTINYFAQLKGVRLSKSEIGEYLDRVGLNYDTKFVGQYSGGMKRRLALAISLIGNPSLMIIDEPTAGVDAEGRILIRKILGDISRDKNIILSTHTISDVEWLANTIIVIKDQGVGFAGTPDELIHQEYGHIWSYRVDLNERVESTDSVLSLTRRENSIEVVEIAEHAPKEDAVMKTPSLEEAYLALTNA